MSSISQVIALINQMENDGVIERYAVGGAVGATFFLKPVSTLDVDIFKDKARLLQFVESGVLNADRFQSILARHDLNGKWQEFKNSFLSGAK